MADLSTLDPLAPPGSEDRSLGDDRIRETRAAILNSYAIEHALAGPHKFLTGAPGALPAAGNLGRIFIDTTNNDVLMDDGSKWGLLRTLGFRFQSSVANLAFIGVTYTNLLTQSVVVPESCSVLGFGLISLATSGAAVDTIYTDITYGGGNSLTPKDQTITYPGTGANVQVFYMGSKVIAAGTYTFALRTRGATVGGNTAYQVMALMLV